MRTSNKILLGFIILVFLIPVLILMSFNSKIKNGRYTVEMQEGQGSNFRNGHFNAYKVVKLVSPVGRMLKVNLLHSDSLYYNYYQVGYGDSVRVYNEGDTVFVSYINGQIPGGGGDEMATLYMNMKLPSFENLIIDNAEVTLGSTDSTLNSDINAALSGTALLKIGKENTERGGPDDDTTREFNYNINRLSVTMNEGAVEIGSKVDIRQINLQVSGPGEISINDGAAIGEMTGNLSGESSVKANWKYVKRLAALATE